MNANFAAPNGHVREVGFLPRHDLVRGGIAKRSSPSAILEPNSVIRGLAPEEFWQAAVMLHRTDLFEQHSIEPLCNAVVLRRVMDREPTNGAICF